MFDIAEECHVAYCGLVDGRKRQRRAGDPFVTVVDRGDGGKEPHPREASEK